MFAFLSTGNPQRLFYRGDKRCHFVNTFLVVDIRGKVVFWKAGFQGHLNDATCYRNSGVPILPNGLKLLADMGFPHDHMMLTPRGQNQHHSRERVAVEHAIARLKVYKCIGTRRFRGSRKMIPILCNVIAALCNRRLDETQEMRGQYHELLQQL